MKIIYLHQYFATPNMSGGTRSYEFAKRLVKMGHEVEMITCWREPYQSKDWFLTEEAGIKVHWLPLEYSNKMNFVQRLKTFILFAWKSTFRAIKLNADIVFASSTPLTISIPAVYISKKKKIPMVFEVRDLWPDIPIAMKILKNPILIYLSKLLEIWAYKNSNSIVALSPEMKKRIVLKNINPKKISVIPNSCDLEEFEFNKKLAINFRDKRSWLNNKPLLVYTGTFGRVNDLSYAVKLAKALIEQNSEIKILLIGDGLEKKKIISKAKKYNVYNKNLFFEKPIPKKEMRGCLSAANMAANFVIDIRENWSNSANKFFDYLAAGKPIFLNHGGWMQDLVINHNCGLCMHGKPIDIVAKKLNSALSNESWLISSGNSSINLAKNFFDRNIHAQQLEKVLILTKENKTNLIDDITNTFFNYN
jgi:glycosyltransferase involved in cell wall biosynthesis